ncbi:hypothetical protein ACFE04_023840 [Oxalis oulophora]
MKGLLSTKWRWVALYNSISCKVSVTATKNPEEASFFESYEAAHSSHDLSSSIAKHHQLELIARQSMELCPEEMEPYICAFQTKDTVRKSGIMLQDVSSSQDVCMPVMDGLEATRLIRSFEETGSWDAALQAGVEPSVLSSNSSRDASQFVHDEI